MIDPMALGIAVAVLVALFAAADIILDWRKPPNGGPW